MHFIQKKKIISFHILRYHKEQIYSWQESNLQSQKVRWKLERFTSQSTNFYDFTYVMLNSSRYAHQLLREW